MDTLHLYASSRSLLPTNIHAFTGMNGSGKTTALHQLFHKAVGNPSENLLDITVSSDLYISNA